MRLTIIPADKFISIDNVGYYIVELPFIPENIHAVQWYGTYGDVEIKNLTTNKIVENIEITDISQFNAVIEAWSNADALAREQAALEQAALEQAMQQMAAQEQEQISTN
jgi:hypothetical protein